MVIHVSADSRYRLFCNGRSVISGPCKGSRFTTYYDVIDLSAYLREGENLLAIKVLHYPPVGENLSVWRYPLGMLYVTGEVVYRDGRREHIISDESWLCREDLSTRFVPGHYYTMFLGGTEEVQGSMVPHHWQELGYDDGHWDHCAVYQLVDTSTGVLEPWQLNERVIPPLYEEQRDFLRLTGKGNLQEPDERILRACSGTDESSFLFGSLQRYVLEIDAGELSTGFVMLAVSGGTGSIISMLCAECYEDEPIEIPWQRNKGIRDDAVNGRLYGDSDQYVVAGVGTGSDRQYERYEPFLFKTFRYIRLEISVGEEPLTLHSFQYRATGYPLDTQAEFRCSDSMLNTLWDMSLTTLERCMHESYEDCPYYEQFQYVQDTYLQTLFTYKVSGDDRMARKAIHDFHSSLLPQGLIQSRFPSIEPQIIPGFTIYWILMIYDHYQFFHDVEMIRRYLPTIDAVLGWFDRQLNRDGLVDDIPDAYWQFVDWVTEWRDLRGVPAAARSGPLTVYNLMYALGLQKAAELNTLIKRDCIAQEYLVRSQSVNDSVRMHCWSEERQLFKDGPDTELYSQHAQIWAVLAHTLTGDTAVKLMKDTLASDSLATVSYAMTFFLFRALSQTGLYHKSFDLWDPWRSMTQMHLTTWAEDPVTQRSDCHAWGSLPLYEFTSELLGVGPSVDASEVITVSPVPGELFWAQGVVVTSFGLLSIRWQRTTGVFRLTIYNPSNITVRIIMPSGTRYDDMDGCVIELEQ
ncbi:MAG: alpha-L-rhamnosidase N-terminal domain-containing protein [Spirochaetia bacterium]|nr:alpha-L-rhamnosidase N-terminal domain-containing protein [Spirochaetia bacterium]